MIDLEMLRRESVRCDGAHETVKLYGSQIRELIDRLQAAESKCKLLDGISQDAIDGGWTAQGLSKYTKSLEVENSELRCKLDELEKQEPIYQWMIESDDDDESWIDCSRDWFDHIKLLSVRPTRIVYAKPLPPQKDTERSN